MPEKIEIIPDPLALVELRHRAKKPVLPFEADRGVLDRGRFARRRCAREFSSFGSALSAVGAATFLLAGRVLGQQIKFRLPKPKVLIERHRQRNDPVDEDVAEAAAEAVARGSNVSNTTPNFINSMKRA